MTRSSEPDPAPIVAEPADSPPPAAPEDTRPPAAAIYDWSELLTAAEIRGGARQLGDNCEVAKLAGSRLELILDREKQHLLTEQIRGRLEKGLATHLRIPLKLTVTPGKPPRRTPAEIRIVNENERMRAARRSIEEDPTVRAMQATFGGVVEADTIQPIDK